MKQLFLFLLLVKLKIQKYFLKRSIKKLLLVKTYNWLTLELQKNLKRDTLKMQKTLILMEMILNLKWKNWINQNLYTFIVILVVEVEELQKFFQKWGSNKFMI